jgi:outer membrane scaffolding protein for murein synthesis (MipA/OmpV family)
MKHRVITLLIALAAVSGAAHAEAESTYLFSTTSAYLGGGVAYMPRYAGSKDYRATPLLDASVHFKNGFYADSAQGVGYQFKFSDRFYATAALGADPGRKEKDDVLRPGSDYLKGMGDIKQAALAHIGLGFQFNDRSDISLMASKAMGQASYGASLHLLGHVVAWKDNNNIIDLNGAVHYGNRDYNQTYFGISEVQSTRTRFTAFTPGSGIYAVDATATWTHQFSGHWFTRVSGGATRYMRDVGHSPIVQEKTGYILASSLDYRF